jgi:excinuclease ABC subunit C
MRWALPCAPGVYRFRDERGTVLYIGRAVDLRRRVSSYWGELRDRRHLAPMVRRIARVEAVVCDSAHEAAWLERNLLEHRMPRWNRTAGGQEVPTYIRLDTRPAAPGLTVEHAPSGPLVFGPYLGGDKVRLAVAGLLRRYPLNYTGTRMSGSERAMAATLGVEPGDRERLVEELAAVLRRETNIHHELVQRRDRAAAQLAFELAGKLQAELEAVEWITAPQRVTGDPAGDLDVYGWADGILVEFQIRAGRLCGWTQRTCSEATARRRVAGTPAQWRAFTDRAARLAAELTNVTS